ncbi:MAG: putative polymerase subfamily sigma factor [Acidimicrobiales bacterium]|nr:putative polymerase subfamily sigma factor [Acidimicrobiales bacterium]
MVRDSVNDIGSFEEFAIDADGRLRRALVARFGVEVGHDVANDAMAFAWEHRDRVCEAANPLGLLYRVGQSSARRYRRWNRRVELPAEEPFGESQFEPGLAPALAEMRSDHRVAVVLIHGYGWSYADTAAMLDVPVSTVRNWATRGLHKLRQLLKEST